MKPKVGVVFTLLELYRKADPERPATLGALWRENVTSLLADDAELHFTDVACTASEVASAVASCEDADCDLLIVLPLAYATSGSARDALARTTLPLLIVSTARDATLPHDMTGDHIMANHAMHGVQDLANVLGRAGRSFDLVAGHPSQDAFRAKLCESVRAAAAARVLRRGKVARVGTAFEGMLDFSFDTPLPGGGFKVTDAAPSDISPYAENISGERVGKMTAWVRETFDLEDDLTEDELGASVRVSLAFEDLVTGGGFDAFSMNFLEVAKAGVATMPFLGASRLMSHGIGYAGEGDVLTAALVAACGRITPETTFTEMFCPDYGRDEVLLSHMGECNLALASPARPMRLVAKPFPWGDCARPATPVFQLKPGTVTMTCLTAWPGEVFRLIATLAEVREAPEHANLSSPYSRIRFGGELAAFLERYSHLGGTHHLALMYGDRLEALARLAGFCDFGYVTV
jgi:L-arabinose isomerase